MKKEQLKDTKVKVSRYDRITDLIALREKDLEIEKERLLLASDELSKERIKRNIKSLNMEIMGLEKDSIAIDKGFEHLDDVSSKIVRLKFIKKESWVSVALATGYGQSRCRELGNDALIVIDECLHGIKDYRNCADKFAIN